MPSKELLLEIFKERGARKFAEAGLSDSNALVMRGRTREI